MQELCSHSTEHFTVKSEVHICCKAHHDHGPRNRRRQLSWPIFLYSMESRQAYLPVQYGVKAGLFACTAWQAYLPVQHGRPICLYNMAGLFACATWQAYLPVQHGIHQGRP